MSAPTLSQYSPSSTFELGGGARTTGSLTWVTGDVIVVVGIVADTNAGATFAAPTASGLTFAQIAEPTNTASTCKMYAWSATATSGGSGAVSADYADIVGRESGIFAFVWTSTSGIGNASLDASLGSTTTKSLTRTSDQSGVVQMWADWNAINDTTVTWTPSGFTQREASTISGKLTWFGATWGDQGSAGSSSYGFSGFAGGTMTAVTIEILGVADLPTLDAVTPDTFADGTTGIVIMGTNL